MLSLILYHINSWIFFSSPDKDIFSLSFWAEFFLLVSLHLFFFFFSSYRFTDMFPDTEHVRDMQKELDEIIQIGVFNITKLLRNSETATSSRTDDSDDDFEIKTKQKTFTRNSTDKAIYPEEEEGAKDYAFSEKSETGFYSKQFREAKSKQAVKLGTGQSIADQLITQGLITPDQLQKLQQEFLSSNMRGKPGRGPKKR